MAVPARRVSNAPPAPAPKDHVNPSVLTELKPKDHVVVRYVVTAKGPRATSLRVAERTPPTPSTPTTASPAPSASSSTGSGS